ncbi:MAG: haloacid dehalogenase-like hydrolase [Desulfomonile tiedjei]|nr:haloacid dehalogenase-like hydrolase [Desulfomonile tiedjei]
MLVGVDFDNTIVCYDRVFHRAAVMHGLIPRDLPPTKGQVRDYLRRAGREDQWTELQGFVYGVMIQEAKPFPGVLDFFRGCRARAVPVCIVSHKTHYPFEGPQYDLHAAADRWLEALGFYDPLQIGLSRSLVHFELTKKGKLDRIAAMGCSHFIDDLPEFLEEAEFPRDVNRILFDPGGVYRDGHDLARVQTWEEVKEILIDRKLDLS